MPTPGDFSKISLYDRIQHPVDNVKEEEGERKQTSWNFINFPCSVRYNSIEFCGWGRFHHLLWFPHLKKEEENKRKPFFKFKRRRLRTLLNKSTTRNKSKNKLTIGCSCKDSTSNSEAPFLLLCCFSEDFREKTFTTANSSNEAKTKIRHTDIHTSMALMYDTLGREARAPLDWKKENLKVWFQIPRRQSAYV